MTTSRLDAPERSDLLPVEEVDALIQAADRELSALEREAAEATAAADAMQQRVVDEGADERSSSWAMMQLRRFLDGLSDEVDREVAALVDVAERWAKQRVAEAHAEAEAVGARPRTTAPDTADSTPEAALDAGPPATIGWKVAPPEPAMAAEPVVAPVPAPVTPVVVHAAPVPVTDVEPRAAEVSEAPLAQVTPDLIDVAPTAATEPPAAFAQPDFEGAEPVAIAWTPAPVTEIGAQPASTPVEPEAAATVGSVAGEGDAFWTGAEPEKPKRKLRRIPWTAVLQVIAVLAILVFILLRLS